MEDLDPHRALQRRAKGWRAAVGVTAVAGGSRCRCCGRSGGARRWRPGSGAGGRREVLGGATIKHADDAALHICGTIKLGS